MQAQPTLNTNYLTMTPVVIAGIGITLQEWATIHAGRKFNVAGQAERYDALGEYSHLWEKECGLFRLP